jgi:hypothetical protein
MAYLDDIEKLIAAATPGPWPKLIARVDIGWIGHGPGHPSEGTINRALNDALFIASSRELMPRIVKALRTLEWISEHRIIECGRWTEAVMKSREALAELEQP